MHPRYQEHFQEMNQRLSSCWRARGETIWILLKATAITRFYRKQLPLPDVRLTQLAYFKEHLPVFEAEVQYFDLRYELERRRPNDSGKKTWAGFWLEEASRMQQQIDAESERYDYYRRGATDQDQRYFDGDPALAEQNALLWGTFMALSRYEQELESIFASFFNT